jgi:molecular chaperone HtpG
MPADQKSIYYIAGGKESTLKASPLLESYRKKGFEVLIMSDDIDDIVVGSIGTYKEMPLKAINKSGAVDDLKEEKDTEKTKEAKSLVKKIKKALGDKVKDVVVSSRLVESPAVVVVDENDPSVQMQQILKSMGQGDFEDVKPILEINVDDPMIMKIDASDDTQYIEDLCSVLLDQALLAEGVMPKDPVAFTKKLQSLLSK